MSRASVRILFCGLAIVAFFSGCAGYPPTKSFYNRFGMFHLPGFAPVAPAAPLEPPPVKKQESYWNGDGANGAPTIVVRLGEQRAYFYRGRKVVGATRISTGKKGYATPSGNYSVIQKDRHHVSNLYGDYVGADGEVVKSNVTAGKDPAPEGSTFRGAKMPYFLRFSGGYGLHSGRVPNYPASHGCVRLPAEMAKHFFDNAEGGTPVLVEE
jgi:lipoprotein-anchoring transpeptidase ErfK/SrfK